MMRFADLMNRHALKRVWIIGTGPSLDSLDPADIDGPRILIHRAAFRVPAGADSYWLVMDDAWGMGIPGPWKEMLSRVRSGEAGLTGVFRNPMGSARPNVEPPAGDHIVWFNGVRPRHGDVLLCDRPQIAETERLYACAGAAATALHLAWFMGASEVVCSGIDGGRLHAKCLDEFYPDPDPSGQGFGYLPAFDCFQRVRRALGVPVERIEDVLPVGAQHAAPEAAKSEGENA